MPANKKNFFIALSIFTFIFVGLIVFAVPANSQTGTNLITSFTNGTTYKYDDRDGVETFTSNSNNIVSAEETRKNYGGAASNKLTLDTTKNYTLTYTYTRTSGEVPSIRFVQNRNGRSTIFGYGTGTELNKFAMAGTNSITFKPVQSEGYLEISVANDTKTNFAMTNINLVVVPPVVTPPPQSEIFGPITNNSSKTVIESPSASPFSSSVCPGESVLVGFDLYNVGQNYSKTASLYCRTVPILVSLGPVIKHDKKVIESPGKVTATRTQIDLSSCPDGSVLVGFNLLDMGENYSRIGSLYCREVLSKTNSVQTILWDGLAPYIDTVAPTENEWDDVIYIRSLNNRNYQIP